MACGPLGALSCVRACVLESSFVPLLLLFVSPLLSLFLWAACVVGGVVVVVGGGGGGGGCFLMLWWSASTTEPSSGTFSERHSVPWLARCILASSFYVGVDKSKSKRPILLLFCCCCCWSGCCYWPEKHNCSVMAGARSKPGRQVVIDGVELAEIGSSSSSSASSKPRSTSRANLGRDWDMPDELRFQKASIYVTNALRGRLTTTDDPKLYAFFHGNAWYWTYIVAVFLLCALIIFENPSTMWRYLVPHDEFLLHIPFGAIGEDGKPGAMVSVEQSIAFDLLEILLCGVLFYDYYMRRIIYKTGNKKAYYKYTKKERRNKRRKEFDPKDPHLVMSDLPIHVDGGDPLITNLWTNFELILACILVGNAATCLVTTIAYWKQVVPHFGRLVRPFLFLVKMVNVYVDPQVSLVLLTKRL